MRFDWRDGGRVVCVLTKDEYDAALEFMRKRFSPAQETIDFLQMALFRDLTDSEKKWFEETIRDRMYRESKDKVTFITVVSGPSQHHSGYLDVEIEPAP